MTYNLLLSDPLSLLAYALLLASIASLWARRDIRIWGAIAGLSVICGLVAARITPVGALIVTLLGAHCYAATNTQLGKSTRIGAGIAAVIASAFLAAHVAPGFNNWEIIQDTRLGTGSAPLSLSLTMDKPFIGLFILGFGFPLITRHHDWVPMLRTTGPIFLIGLLLLAVTSLLLGFTRWDPKLSDVFVVWALKNLFFTCISEEAVFRGLLQQKLTQKLETRRHGKAVGLIAVSVLFGLVHLGGGASYALLSTLAGLLYGYAYLRTGRIEAAILCHFGVNACHFLLLTYPAAI